MEPNGISRKIDELGRITIPKELCKKLNIVRGQTFLEILSEGERILLQHEQKPVCVFCMKDKKTIMYNGKHICGICLDAINKMGK